MIERDADLMPEPCGSVVVEPFDDRHMAVIITSTLGIPVYLTHFPCAVIGRKCGLLFLCECVHKKLLSYKDPPPDVSDGGSLLPRDIFVGPFGPTEISRQTGLPLLYGV